MRKALSPDPVLFDDSRRTWANSEGTTLLATLETLTKAMEDIQEKVESQGKESKDLQQKLESQGKELEEAQKQSSNMSGRSMLIPLSHTRRSQRNAAAHGGSILADYDVILHEAGQQSSRVDRWKPAFESQYGVSWDFLNARGGLDLASKELVRIFDYLANTRSLEKWEDWKILSNSKTSTKKFEDRAEIIATCSNWIAKWVGEAMDTNPTKRQMQRLRKLSDQA
ncbi:uncharacterized protein N7518_007737 [Penicillium psychrosexuale]|uniref:uncharacterized protein n=1 Tax=Penicillium psychrosexuale TaxID=1002107 RepID=UPI002545BB81|nr:uncharacterized protein N7518_007737 [Penicillium psychrosexuale]KAJ5790726.1 hypothetical protein N7518_007737 [Penicillium psychrosexuale]